MYDELPPRTRPLWWEGPAGLVYALASFGTSVLVYNAAQDVSSAVWLSVLFSCGSSVPCSSLAGLAGVARPFVGRKRLRRRLRRLTRRSFIETGSSPKWQRHQSRISKEALQDFAIVMTARRCLVAICLSLLSSTPVLEVSQGLSRHKSIERRSARGHDVEVKHLMDCVL